MEVKQLYDLVNTTTKEVIGLKNLQLNEDLSNLVDIGNAIFNANAVENYTRKLVDHIGRVVFVNRVYSGSVPKVLKTGWEFGSCLEKVHASLPNATENESWELEDGSSYDPNIFYKPSVSVKFFNSKTTFEVPISITSIQLKSAFSNATQLNGFVSMIFNEIEKTLTIKVDSLIMRTIDNFIAETINSEYTDVETNTKSGVRAVNLLYLYNQSSGTTLTKEKALTDKEFLRFASRLMNLYVSRMSKINTLYNIGATTKFTPRDLLHVVLLDSFVSSCNSYLSADTFHNEMVSLPKYEEVAYWQGLGTNFEVENTSKISVKTSSGHSVTQDYIVGVMFDNDALGVTNEDKRVTSNYNGKAEFTNYWFKEDASYFNDFNEQFVVFFLA